MNTLKNLFISLLLLGLSAQAFAMAPTITNVERTAIDTLRVTFSAPVKAGSLYPSFIPIADNMNLILYSETTQYQGKISDSSSESIGITPTAINADSDGLAAQWEWNGSATALAAIDADGLTSVNIRMDPHYFRNADVPNGSVIATVTRTLVVSRSNDNPAVINNTNVSRNEGVSLSALTITATNTPSSETLAYSIAGTDAGLFDLNGSTVTFKTAPDYENPADNGGDNIYNLALNVNDGLSTTTKAITITINNIIEDTIAISNQDRAINENSTNGTAVGIVLTTTGSPSAFSITSGNDNGAFAINNSGQISVADATKMDHETATTQSIQVTISKTDADNKTATIAITINNVNEATITLNNQTRAINENSTNGTTVGTVLTTTGSPSAFSITSGNTNGAFAINNSGQITVADATKMDHETATTQSIQVTISKTDADNKTATITVNIQDVNDNAPTAPTFTSSNNIPENTTVGTELGTLKATDADSNNGTRTYSVTGTNAAFFEITSNQLKLKQAVDYETLKTLTITINASDGTNTSPNTSLTFNITNIDDTAPNEPTLSNNTILKDSAIGTEVGTLSAEDVDTNNATLTYTLDGTDKDKFEITGNKLKTKVAITAALGTTYSITITASDGTRTSSAKAFSITVTEDLAITSADAFNADEGTTTNHTLVANQSGATFSILGTTGLFSLSGTTLTFNGTTTDFESTTKTYTVKIKASTGSAADENIEQTITVNLQDVDDTAPTALSFTGNTNLPESTSTGAELGTLSATDTDTATLTYSVTPTATFEIDGNKLKLKTAVDYETLDPKTLTAHVSVSDGTRSISKDFVFTITDVDDTAPGQPTLSNSTASKDSAVGTLVGTLSAVDVDTNNNALTYVLDGTNKANFEIVGNQLKTKTTLVFGTSYSITIATSDGTRNSIAQSFSITVTQDLAITSANTFNAPEGTSVTHTLSASDTNAEFSFVGNAGLFSLSGAKNTTLTFNGTNTDFESTTKSYTVKVKATIGSTADKNTEQTITVNLANVDEATTVSISGGGKTSISKTVTLTANATDPDTALTYAWIQISGDTITLSATNTKSVSFDTTAAMEGRTFGFKVTVNGVEATTTVTVNNAEVIAQAVRKESKAASKVLINRVSKTMMGRLSSLRQKQNQSSSFNANGFNNGIQIQFANSELSTAVNSVLGANGLNSTIKIPTRKFNRWDTWSSGKIVIGKSKGEGNNKTKFKLKSLNIGADRKIEQDKIIGFALGLGKENRTSTGTDFSGDVDTTQWSLSSYGSLELNKQTSLEAVIGVAKAKHKVSSSSTASDNQKSNGYFASVAYRGTLQKGKLDLSPYARYDISRVKLKATEALTNSETATDEALALGIDANHAIDYKNGKLNRFVNLEYKSDLRRDATSYISQNAEQEVTMKLGVDYQVKDTNIAVNYERVQSTNNKAHSNGVEGTVRWKF